MRIAKTFIAAVALALALVAAVVVPLALSAAAGTFGFDSWPTSAAPPPRENAVVIDQPLVLSGREAARAPSRTPVLRDVVVQSRASAKPSGGALVAQVDRGSPRPIAAAPTAEVGTEQRP